MKRKIILTLTLAIMLTVVLALSINASEPVKSWDISQNTDGSVMAYLYNDTQNSGKYTLTVSGNGNMKDWSAEEAPWYSSYRNNITSVTIEEGVTTIGDWAFSNCDSLTSVVIPDSVKTIGNYAFYYCKSLASIVIPDSVTTIGEYAFSSCFKLTSVEIGNSVTTIGNDAFRSCDSLTSIEVDENNTAYKSIDGNLYTKDGKTLVQYAIGKKDTYFKIPEGVTTIGEDAFWSCDSLTSVVIGNSVTTIGDSAFWSCDSLTSVVIGDSVTTIGDGAFEGCDALTSVKIGDSVTTIGEWAFSSCDALTSVVIGNGVTAIGEYAFYSCTSLTSVEIGNSVTTIGSSAFSDCDSLIRVVIPDSVTTIGDSAFEDCYNLTSVEIGDSVTTIGYEAFYSCTSLTSVVIPDSVTTISNCAFEYCKSLASVEIGDSVTTIGTGAFRNCKSLTSIEVDENNTAYKSIEGNLYTKDGKKLIQYAIGKKDTYFKIPEGVTTIGINAFYYCKSLTSVVIPDSVTTIGNYAFYGCSNLTIYAEATSKPSGWNSSWNNSNRPVVWGYFDENGCLEKIFTFKGYSFGPNGSMAVGYGIDYKALAKYERKTGKELKIGVAFASLELLGGQNPIDSQGNAITLDVGRIANRDLTYRRYSYYDFIVTGITEDLTDYSLVIAAYINDGTVTKYVQQNGLRDNVSGITYNEAKENVAQ